MTGRDAAGRSRGHVLAERAAGLQAELRRLDALLAEAVSLAEQAYGPAAAADPFRGLHLGAADLAAVFDPRPGVPFLHGPDPQQGSGETAHPLAWLAESFELSPFDLDVVLVALAPEVDLRYERVYAYLQDDVTRRQPSVELVLNLLCSSPEGKLAGRDRLAPGAPLLRHDLLLLDPPGDRTAVPLPRHTLRLDPQIVDVLLGQGGVDRRLAGCCRLLLSPSTGDSPTDGATVEALGGLVEEALATARPLRLYFQGAPGTGRRRTAAAVAARVGRPLLHVDARCVDASDHDDILRLVFRETRLHEALLYLDGVDALRDDERDWSRLLELLERNDGVAVLAGTRPWPPAGRTVTGTTTVPFGLLPAEQRRVCWQRAVTASGWTLDDDALDLLAARFQLTPSQIEEAAASAATSSALRRGAAAPRQDGSSTRHRLTDLFAAARGQTGHELAALARRVSPACGWQDLVLPVDALAQLQEICARARCREQVLGEWGFGAKLSRGRGTSALFSGPAGTGKTMAAEVIAGELGLDLFAIDLASVVSKYIGETEKNLDRIFRAADGANAVLLFDEADALFGKRSEVRDSHDRYANIEISFLLQKIEEFDGIAILATNLRQHIDEAFLRRLAFSITFPFPDAASRRRIWEVIWPPKVPRGDDVDLEALAERFALSGGNIRNVALAAAYLAAADGHVVRTEHLMHATRREYQKLGKALTDAQLGVSAA